MNIHDFAGYNLIFTMTTGKYVLLINVVHTLILLDIITTKVIFTCIMYFPRDLEKICFCYLKQDKLGCRIFIVVQGWAI